MNTSADIKLHWLVKLQLGSPSPRGQRFALPARFDHQGEDWTSNAWSVVIEVDGMPDASGYQSGKAHFLAENPPHDWLTTGRRFTLCEGTLSIAEAEVLTPPTDSRG